MEDTTSEPPTTLGAPIPEAPSDDGVATTPAPGDVPVTPPAAEPPASEPPATAPPTTPTRPMPFRGINLAGGEFGGALPGVAGKDYTFPTPAEVDYYMSKGMNVFRIGFKWERLQPSANGPFQADYASRLYSIAKYASSKGAHVILNPHNFARYYGNTVGSTQVPNSVFADFWSKLSTEWKADPNIMFNLVNEPNTMATEQWVGAANAAILAIRATGATNAIVVPGNAWTGAHSWTSSSYGTPNSVALLNIVDPGDNVIFEAHQYLDASSSGGGGECISTTVGAERLVPFVKWLRDNKRKGMIGEFAGGKNQTCYTAITNMLTYMMESADVLVGWQWWAGGPGWGNYPFTLEPSGGKDQPQMAVLAPFL